MKTRNLLPPSANDVWTSDVHFRAYSSVLLTNPTLDKPMAYIAKGVDYNEDGIFEPSSEYDVWAERASPTSPLNITVYYDFNGVYWHDGVQMTPWDLFFSYHVSAMNARFNTDLRVLYCSPAATASYDNCGRQLGIDLVSKNWQGEANIPGDPTLRVAVKYKLVKPFALFYDSTLFPVMMPMHEWSRTYGGRHVDFGCAIWIPTAIATAQGITECGNVDNSKWGHGIASAEPVPGSKPYAYSSAEQWVLADQDIIGNGPFKFERWIPNTEAKVVRYENYFTGIDPLNGAVYDAQLSRVLHKPTIEGIRYLVYKTTQLGVFALQGADVDFYHWNVGADFVPDLLKIPEIAVESNAEPGFFYLAYNLRSQPWGYTNGNPAQDDGYWLRQAFSHVIDKKSIVQNLLQNFGVVGHGTVSPANTFWFNPNIPKPDYDLTLARAILDDPLRGGRAGVGADPPGACTKDTPSGCRSLPRIGNAMFEILTPQADYDPVRASAGAMVADAMRQVGINAFSKPTAFGEIVNRINLHQFELFILGWRISGTDPDYLFSFFDSSNGGVGGQNYPGFNNATFDTAIGNSRAELDRNTRRTYIFTCQQLLADARPYDVLYFRTNIEGYRQDRFVNWTVSSGSIWGYWSLIGIHPPSANALHLVISTESAAKSGATEIVTVTVFDNQNLALAGAAVNVSVPQGNDKGNLTLNVLDTPAKYVVATSDANGQVRARYTAAGVGVKTSVIVSAVATKQPTFPDPARASRVVSVFPAGVSFLSVRVDLPLGDRVSAGSTLPLSIGVKDQDRNTVGDAAVVIAAAPTGQVTPNPGSGPASSMGSVTLTASSTVTSVTTVTLTVQATKTGLQTGSVNQQVTVVPSGSGTHRCLDGKVYPASQQCPTVQTPGLEVLPILAGIGVAALVAGVIAERKRRS